MGATEAIAERESWDLNFKLIGCETETNPFTLLHI